MTDIEAFLGHLRITTGRIKLEKIMESKMQWPMASYNSRPLPAAYLKASDLNFIGWRGLREIAPTPLYLVRKPLNGEMIEKVLLHFAKQAQASA